MRHPIANLVRTWLRGHLRQVWPRQARRGCSPRVHLRLEPLEDRLAPAVISDGGMAALGIVLGAGENIAIASAGDHYTISSNQNFTAPSATDPANQGTAFGGLGTQALTITAAGLAQYASGIAITDTGGGATVVFSDSGANAYSNSFTVTLSDPAAGAIAFMGNSDFGGFNVKAATTNFVLVGETGTLTSDAGTLTLQAKQQTAAPGRAYVGVPLHV